MRVFKWFFLLIFFALSVHAQEYVFSGAIDSRHTLHVFLKISSGKAEATYFYDRIGLPIALEGTATAGNIVMENSGERFTGTFDGKFYTGTWTDKRRRHDLQFALQPAETSLREISGRYKCTASRSGAGGAIEVPLTLEMKAGTVTRLELQSRVMPQAHTCNPDYSKFRQAMRSDTLTITGTATPDTPCPMSLRRAGPFIHMANTGGACLCGARASIPDVLLDTRNNSCRVAQ